MTLKQLQLAKMVIAVILGIIFAESIIYKNYLLPLLAIILSLLILLAVRSRVKEVISDERDYLMGGKAARLAIQVYSWLAVAALFILYTERDLNPAYEPIALTLAYSTCLLMLLYALLFKYYDKFNASKKKIIYIISAALLLLIILVSGIRFFSGEDDWICQDGQWIKHGYPSFPAPERRCR